KRQKNKQKEKSSSKKQKNSSKDKENIVEIDEFDENPRLEVQRKINDLA
ncbi:17811_t:CDS:1, partial [Funneliformis caledonium]